jgi:serine/threonine protein kinase
LRPRMALTSGTRLGPYEIQSPLGAGGMGEVYRARDTRLGRDVAIKELPDALARDADRLRRFEQVLPLPRLRRSQSKCSGFDTVFIR